MLVYEFNSYKEKWVVNAVQKAIGTIAHQVSDTTRAERRIMIRVGRYISQDTKNRLNRGYIRRLIYREINDALKRNKREHAEFIEDLSAVDEEGQAIQYEPVDTLASVESDLIVKETITLLAKDDRRRKMILTEWANGNTNDSDISDTLARVFGGQARSHRIFIQRFRIECRTELTAQAI